MCIASFNLLHSYYEPICEQIVCSFAHVVSALDKVLQKESSENLKSSEKIIKKRFKTYRIITEYPVTAPNWAESGVIWPQKMPWLNSYSTAFCDKINIMSVFRMTTVDGNFFMHLKKIVVNRKITSLNLDCKNITVFTNQKFLHWFFNEIKLSKHLIRWGSVYSSSNWYLIQKGRSESSSQCPFANTSHCEAVVPTAYFGGSNSQHTTLKLLTSLLPNPKENINCSSRNRRTMETLFLFQSILKTSLLEQIYGLSSP